jgi:predicted Zn-dependent protease
LELTPAAAQLRLAATARDVTVRAWALGTLADVLLRAGSAEEAIEAARAAVDADPSKEEYHLQLADALASVGRWSDALVVLDRGRETASSTGRLDARARAIRAAGSR